MGASTRPWARWLLALALVALGCGHGAGGGGRFTLPTDMEGYARLDPQPQPRPEVLGEVSGPAVQVVMIDVGQGDSFLVADPWGHVVLVDSGPPDAAGAVAREVGRHGGKIDLFIATHGHDDHIGGFPRVAQRFPVAAVLDSGIPVEGPVYEEYRRTLSSLAGEAPVVHLRRGVVVQLTEERVAIYRVPDHQGFSRCLFLEPGGPREALVKMPRAWLDHVPGPMRAAPSPEEAARDLPKGPTPDPSRGVVFGFFLPQEPLVHGSRSDPNANSAVFTMRYGGMCMLFTGDSEFETEDRLLAQDPPAGRSCQVLKVGHHGSRYATQERFLDHVSPRVALVSAGRFNPFGHPAPVTMKRLYEHGIWTYRTDKMGTVTLRTDGEHLALSYERTEKFWRRYLSRRRRGR